MDWGSSWRLISRIISVMVARRCRQSPGPRTEALMTGGSTTADGVLIRVMAFLIGNHGCRAPADGIPTNCTTGVEPQRRDQVNPCQLEEASTESCASVLCFSVRGSQHKRELSLILGHELIARRQELEDGDHGLTGLLADSFAISLDQFEAEGQGIGILARAARASARANLSLRSAG